MESIGKHSNLSRLDAESGRQDLCDYFKLGHEVICVRRRIATVGASRREARDGRVEIPPHGFKVSQTVVHLHGKVADEADVELCKLGMCQPARQALVNPVRPMVREQCGDGAVDALELVGNVPGGLCSRGREVYRKAAQHVGYRDSPALEAV